MITAQDIDDAFTAVYRTLSGFGALQTDGQLFAPQEEVPYAFGRMSAIVAMPGGYGADSVINWRGTYTILVNSPRSLGKQFAGQMAATVIEAFPRALSVVTTAGPAMQVDLAQAAPADDMGDWITIPVNVNWFGTDP